MFDVIPFQQEAIARVREACRLGSKYPLLVAPTGAGKTVMGASICAGHLSRGEARSIAWFAHRTELVDQAAQTFRDLGLEVGMRGLSKSARVQIGMVQTACARDVVPPATMAVLDESHHYVSEEWKRVPAAYREQGAMILGLTATPERADGLGLGGKDGIFDSITVAAQTGDLIRLGRLAPFEIQKPKAAIRSARVAMLPVDAYCKFSPGRSAVVFAPNIANAEEFAEQFRTRNIGVCVVHGGLTADERASRLASFDVGDVPVIVNVGVLTEGWDSPRAKVAIIARKIGSTSLYLQIVGRVLRLWNNETAQIIDLTGVVEAHGPPDEEREFFLEGEAVRRKGVAAGVTFCRLCHAEKPAGESCPVCGTAPSETEILKAQGVELEKFAGMRALSADKRADRLAKWYVECDRRGHKRTSAHYKFKAVFGHMPTSEILARASEVARKATTW